MAAPPRHRGILAPPSVPRVLLLAAAATGSARATGITPCHLDLLLKNLDFESLSSEAKQSLGPRVASTIARLAGVGKQDVMTLHREKGTVDFRTAMKAMPWSPSTWPEAPGKATLVTSGIRIPRSTLYITEAAVRSPDFAAQLASEINGDLGDNPAIAGRITVPNVFVLPVADAPSKLRGEHTPWSTTPKPGTRPQFPWRELFLVMGCLLILALLAFLARIAFLAFKRRKEQSEGGFFGGGSSSFFGNSGGFRSFSGGPSGGTSGGTEGSGGGGGGGSGGGGFLAGFGAGAGASRGDSTAPSGPKESFAEQMRGGHESLQARIRGFFRRPPGGYGITGH